MRKQITSQGPSSFGRSLLACTYPFFCRSRKLRLTTLDSHLELPPPEDRTIIAAAIPGITDEFNSIQDIGWYGSAYMLTAACFNPITGRIYQLYSTQWVFLISIVIFETGSVICGAPPNSTAFIIGRAIAGLGSAGVFSGGMMITLPLVPLRKRPIFTSLFGLAFGISSVLGPVIGGTLTDHV